MDDELVLHIRLADKYGRTHGCMARQVPRECAFHGERWVEDTRFEATMLGGGMGLMAQRMKVREVRKQALADAMKNMGISLADFLSDKEGWHGADRQESALDSEKDNSPADLNPRGPR